jgi:hypothetical protein
MWSEYTKYKMWTIMFPCCGGCNIAGAWLADNTCILLDLYAYANDRNQQLDDAGWRSVDDQALTNVDFSLLVGMRGLLFSVMRIENKNYQP